jgi:hypothetical protein
MFGLSDPLRCCRERKSKDRINLVVPALYCTHGVLSNLQICWGLRKIIFSLKEALCASSLVIINFKGWLFNVDLTSEGRQKGRSIGEAAPERRPEHNSRSLFYSTFCPQHSPHPETYLLTSKIMPIQNLRKKVCRLFSELQNE